MTDEVTASSPYHLRARRAEQQVAEALALMRAEGPADHRDRYAATMILANFVSSLARDRAERKDP